MKFSLIMATIGREKEVEDFLISLSNQTYSDYELIIVDQNKDRRLDEMIQRYREQLKIVHIHSEKGLSKARNIGLQYVTGEIIAFPDDDCEYPPSLLTDVYKFFNENEDIDGLTGKSVDKHGSQSAGNFGKETVYVTKYNVWNCGISFTIFLRRKLIENQRFDEELGVGANSPYWSGEETDYLLKCISNGGKILFSPKNFTVIHPNPTLTFNKKTFERAYKYGCGFGRVIKKHNYNVFYVGYKLIKPLIGVLIALASLKFGKSKFYFNSLKGRFKGYFN